MLRAVAQHWPEYLMEAAGLGIFMIAAGGFGVLLEYPGSALHQAIPDPTLRRVLMGVAMGGTAVGIIYSPWGKQSGAHINPAVTLTFFRLGKIKGWDAAFYAGSQFIGAVVGVLLMLAAAGQRFEQPPVNYVATLPGASGVAVAFVGELVISFILMLTILSATNTRNVARYTGLLAGLLVAVYITLEGPVSGMSMNPARTLGSAVPGRLWTALWIYFTAPPIGMLLAAETYIRLRGVPLVKCAKLHHDNDKRCIFRCGYAAKRAAAA